MKIETSVKTTKVVAYILAVMGFVFNVVALALNIRDTNIRNNWIEDVGVITEINGYDEKILVSYEYEDSNYRVSPSFYSSEFNLGDELVIFINPNSPNTIYLAKTEVLFFVFFIVGGSLAVVAIGLFAYSGKRQIVITDCFNKGIKKTLKVNEIKKSYVYNNHQAYYFLTVTYNEKEYKSELFKINKDFDLTNLGIVDIYILENGKYYIDLKTYRKKKLSIFKCGD